jgi:hypothetical protein
MNDVSFFQQFFRRQRASNLQAAGLKTLWAIYNDAVEEEISQLLCRKYTCHEEKPPNVRGGSS